MDFLPVVSDCNNIPLHTAKSSLRVCNDFNKNGICKACSFLSVATPAEPRVKKNFFFVQILGGEKLLKFVEKCR